MCMVAKYEASKQILWSNLTSDGEKQPGSSGSCLTPQLFITDFPKMGKMYLLNNIISYIDHRRKGTIEENIECTG